MRSAPLAAPGIPARGTWRGGHVVEPQPEGPWGGRDLYVPAASASTAGGPGSSRAQWPLEPRRGGAQGGRPSVSPSHPAVLAFARA